MNSLELRRISTGSIYKIIFLGSWIGSVPLFFLFGIFASTGLEFVSWNGEYITGPFAVVTTPIVGLFLSAIFAAFVGSLTALGLFIYSKFRPLSLLCIVERIEKIEAADA
jgi:hypothetical protein